MHRFLWVEACSKTMYIHNRVPQRALGKITPEETFTRKKPKVGHFRIFGSITYCHVPNDKRTKLDRTVEKRFFVGYIEMSKAYRIYIPSSRKIIVRRDVKFWEEKAFKRSRELLVDDQSGPTKATIVEKGSQSQGISMSTGTSTGAEESS